MNILVCIKPVPDPEKYNDLEIDNVTKRLKREGISTVINSSDLNALEMALMLKEKLGGAVSVISMSPMFSKDRIIKCLAMGADDAYLISDRAFGGSDTYATSYIIKEAIVKFGFMNNLILTGNESADGATSQVPVQLAEWLDIPYITKVVDIKYEEGHLIVKKEMESKYINYRTMLPIVLSVKNNSNKPRLVTIQGVAEAKDKKLNVITNEDLHLNKSKIGLDGSPTKAGELKILESYRDAKEITGKPDEVASDIIKIISHSGITI